MKLITNLGNGAESLEIAGYVDYTGTHYASI
jgi:hypothetical protein